jgi:hypothetical protein
METKDRMLAWIIGAMLDRAAKEGVQMEFKNSTGDMLNSYIGIFVGGEKEERFRLGVNGQD